MALTARLIHMDLKMNTFTADAIKVSHYFLTRTIDVTRLTEILDGSRRLLCRCELPLPLQQLQSPLDFPESIRSCHSAAGGMLLVVPSSLKRTYWIAFFSFSQKPAFGRSVDIIWILGLVCCLVKHNHKRWCLGLDGLEALHWK